MRAQISSVHTLRGVAALLVVWSHLSAYWLFVIGETSAIQDAWVSVIATPLHIYQDGGFLGVVLFFLISGYIVTHASLSETRRSYVVKRMFRIFPALASSLAVLWLLIHVMAALGHPLLALPGAPASRWVQTLLLVDFFIPGPHVLPVTWTLAIELMFYALVLVAMGRQRTHPLGTTVAMVGVWALACWLVTGSVLGTPPTPETTGLVILAGVLLVGRCIYLAHVRLASRAVCSALAVVTGALVGVFQDLDNPGFLLERAGTAGEPVVTYALALGLFVGMLWWSPSHTIWPLARLGDISYSLYLLHLPVGFAVLGVLHRHDVPHSLATLAAIAASLLAALASYRLVERPSQRAARRLLAGRRVPLVDAAPRVDLG